MNQSQPSKLRDYQEKCVEDLREAFRSVRSVILRLPTGTGKTAVAGEIARLIAERGNGVLALVHKRELVRQFCSTLDRVGLGGQYGVIAAGRAPSPWARFQVASVPTLHRRKAQNLNPRLVIIDECHHVKAKTWEEVLERFPTTKFLGLTATPERLDRKPLGDHFDSIVHGPTIAKLVEDGWMAPVTLKYAPQGLSTKGIKRNKSGELDPKQLGSRITKKVVVSAVNSYRRYGPDRLAIFFAVNRAHSKAVAEEFNSVGIRAAHIDGDTDSRLRDRRMAEFSAGEIRVLCNVDIVSEGTDVPMCDCVMMGCQTQSITRYLQWAGRPSRPDHGRDNLVLDLSENYWIHGRPDDERMWSLDEIVETPNSGEPAKPSNTRCCKNCATVFPSYMGRCPDCNQEYTLDPPEQVDAELLGDSQPSEADSFPMAMVRKELRKAIRRGNPKEGVSYIKEKFKLTDKWEKTTLEVLGL